MILAYVSASFLTDAIVSATLLSSPIYMPSWEEEAVLSGKGDLGQRIGRDHKENLLRPSSTDQDFLESVPWYIKSVFVYVCLCVI